jgi:two-component system, LuxR family, sensor kinase FixL
MTDNEDFRALGNLTEGLKQLVSTELRPPSEAGVAAVNLHEVLEELRIIIEPALRDEETDIVWDVPDVLPPVCADRNGLLHVFMNLVNNSRRALQEVSRKRLTISACAQDGRVTVRFIDTGPGVTVPQHLFQPFHHAAEGAGLGLYVSRVLIRSFAGELRFEPRATGCCFAVELAPQPMEGAVVS